MEWRKADTIKEISQGDATKLLGEAVVLRKALEKADRELARMREAAQNLFNTDCVCSMDAAVARAEKAKRELAKLTAYIEQEKFNWQLDRKRADGAEVEIAKLKEYSCELESKATILHDKACGYKAELAELHEECKRVVNDQKHSIGKLNELREKVDWYFECESWMWDSIDREDIDCIENDYDLPAIVQGREQNIKNIYCPWCESQDEINESFKHARQELGVCRGVKMKACPKCKGTSGYERTYYLKTQQNHGWDSWFEAWECEHVVLRENVTVKCLDCGKRFSQEMVKQELTASAAYKTRGG